MIPHQWTTERLIIADSTLDEASELQRINDLVPATATWLHVEGKDEADCTMASAINDGVLPPTPDRTKERFHLQTVRLNNSQEIIGFWGVYRGFPTADIFWINALTLDPDFQGKGYGTELMTGVSEIAKQLGGFTAMRSYVALNNIPSLKMCVKIGFNKMLAIQYEKGHEDEAHAHVLLEKTL